MEVVGDVSDSFVFFFMALMFLFLTVAFFLTDLSDVGLLALVSIFFRTF